MRGPAADDDTQRDHSIVGTGELLRDHGQFDRAGDSLDGDVGDPDVLGDALCPGDERIGDRGVPASRDDRQTQTGGVRELQIGQPFTAHQASPAS